MKKIVSILVIVFLLVVAASALAENDYTGRYQALKIGTATDAYGVFIIDTKEGHIWVWAEGKAPDGRFITKLRYGGKLSPSQKDDIREVKGWR